MPPHAHHQRDGHVLSWLNDTRKQDNARKIYPRDPTTPTHLLLDGGKYFVGEDTMAVFRTKCRDAVEAGEMVPVTENRTQFFPMYVDLDLQVAAETLTEEAVVAMASIMNAQVHRFFVGRGEPFECVVCTKQGPSKPLGQPPDGASSSSQQAVAPLYKHGVHLHWPELIVDVDRAFEIRESLIAGLERAAWAHLLGTDPVPWRDAVDEAVYSGGLRMVGAPKASKCSECRGAREGCAACKRSGHVYDAAAYGLCTVLRGQQVDDGARNALASNFVNLLRRTTVRAPDTARLTEGYARYAGCPVVVPQRRGTKRKSALPPGVGALEPRYRKGAEVTDPRALSILRRHLVLHSPVYANSRMTVHRSEKGDSYRVALSGEGATHCLNLGADHRSQHVYMVVRRGVKDTPMSYMKCWCRHDTAERRLSGAPCKDFESPMRVLEKEEVYRLFPRKAENVKATSWDEFAQYAHGVLGLP
jgi:hypothetical protein